VGLKTLLLAVCAAVLAGVPGMAVAADRQSITLGAGWRFIKQDVAGAEQPGTDDSKWTKVTLPHSFNASEGDEGTYYRGPTWYRRTMEIARLPPGRRLFLQFDGAATAADVYVNGRRIGSHHGGHATFRFDITDAVRPGINLIAVRVDNSLNKAITPIGGDFTVFGGLYRPVSLIETDDVHIDMLDHGGPGIYARAGAPSGGFLSRSDVSVIARVRNDGSASRTVLVTIAILDATGREVAGRSRKVRLPAHQVRPVELKLALAEPRLWDGVRNPYLYRVVTRLGADGDAVSVPLGVRTVEIDPARGFILNGKPYPLRGANLMHSARPGKGTVVTDAEVAEDFAILREMGSTGVRLTHFQHPQAAYDEADRLGLALWTEIGVNGEVADTPEFRANAAQQMRELIAQNYNHPSVVMWGIGNEVYSTEPFVTRILNELNAVAKAADPSRPTVYAHCCQEDDHPKAMVADAIGFNRYFGWYPDSGNKDIGAWAEGFHAKHPERPFAVSEYGAGASILHQEDPPAVVDPPSGWHPEQYQALYHEKNWLALKDKPYLFGTFVWVAFDLASAGRHEGDRRGINDKGLVTYDRRTRKDAYYWYQANWSNKPMLYITSRRFVERPEAGVEVKAYTNAGPATLFLNGEQLSTIEPKDHILRWNIRLRSGENNVEVRSASGIVDRVLWKLAPIPSSLARAGH
jgi:beta-galactosidase/beta-glucuronidase